MMKESFVAILISIVTDFLTGFLLGSFNHFFLLLPGILILVPASISMRGNVFASLGSRLGTSLHLGEIKEFSVSDKVILKNIYATMYITTVMALLLGIISKASSLVIGQISIEIYDFIIIAFLSGVISGIIMLAVTFFISYKSYEKNYDPDNITSPLITGLGDLFTLPSILLAGYLVLKFHSLSVVLFAVVFFAMVFYLIKDYKKDGRMKIINQSIPILIVCSLVGMVSGGLLQREVELFSAFPSVLLMLPVFLEEGGNMGNIFSSRLSTKLHLGTVSGFNFRQIREDIYLIAKLFVSVFPLVGAITYFVSRISGMNTMPLLKMIELSTASGLLLTVGIVFITYFISVEAYKRGIDPDNVSIPILTSVADVFGIISLIFMFHLIH